uniref:Polyprotein n=1 Tax=Knipowitschia caucasica TaxID=637954 RepID=A0AAV2LIV0_KNICA
MFRPYERESREVDRPQRSRKPPEYLRDYEVSYPERYHVPYDDQTKRLSSPEIIRSIHNMREENQKLSRDVQRLVDMIQSAPAASSHPQSLPERQKETSTPAPTSKQTAASGFRDPRPPTLSALPGIREVSPTRPGNGNDIVENLRRRLQESGLKDEEDEQDDESYTFGDSPPHRKTDWADVKPRYKEEDYDRYDGRAYHRDDKYRTSPPRPSYPQYSRAYSYPAPSYRPSSPRARPDSRYYGYERGYSPGSYRGPKPTIPDFKTEDPREFARLKLALDNLLSYDASEHFKFQILTDHLKCEEALLIADSYSNSPYPFTDTMRALNEMYGQPQQLALKRISNLMDGPNIRIGDIRAFKSFALQVRALVGMLHQLGREGYAELRCGSHVSRLLAKLPHDLRANFHRYVNPINTPIPTLLDLADWLEYEVRIQVSGDQHSSYSPRERQAPSKNRRPDYKSQRSTTILLGSESVESNEKMASAPVPAKEGTNEKPKKYCPFCDSVQHYMNQCSNFKLMSMDQKTQWIKTHNRCWRCGREHQAAKCNLKAKCKQCERKHLDVLHEVNTSQSATATANTKAPEASTCLVSSVSETLYLDRPASSRQVLLKLSRVILHSGNKCRLKDRLKGRGQEVGHLFLHSLVDIVTERKWWATSDWPDSYSAEPNPVRRTGPRGECGQAKRANLGFSLIATVTSLLRLRWGWVDGMAREDEEEEEDGWIMRGRRHSSSHTRPRCERTRRANCTQPGGVQRQGAGDRLRCEKAPTPKRGRGGGTLDTAPDNFHAVTG